MAALREKLQVEARRLDLWSDDHRLLAAFSGGLDSTVLLHLLAHDPTLGPNRVVAAHFDHGLRPESAREAQQAVEFARELGVEIVHERAASSPQGNLEAWARKARYGFLERARISASCDRIVTAHHADDQAETLLLRLLRGSGPDGWRAIHPRRGKVVRPLLQVPRKELERYAERHGLPFVEDPSNQDLAFARNRLRHEILPALEAMQPGAVGHLAAAARRAGEWKEWLDWDVERRIARHGDFPKDFIDIQGFDAWPEALRLAFLRRALPRYRSEISENRWRDLDGWLRSYPGGTRCFDWGSGVLERCGSRLSWRETKETEPHPDAVPFEWHPKVGAEGSVAWGDGTFSWSVEEGKKLWNSNPLPWFEGGLFRAWFDADALPSHLLLRARRDGDRMHLPHLGTRRVSDIFIDTRQPLGLRDRVPLLVAEEAVLWIPGVRRSANATVGDTTQRVLCCRWENG